jgi:hypothetical protein
VCEEEVGGEEVAALRFDLIPPGTREKLVRIVTVVSCILGVILFDWLPIKILFAYWGVVFGLSLLTWWNLHVLVVPDRVTIRGFTRTTIPIREIMHIEEHPFGPRTSLAPFEPVRRINQRSLQAASAYSKSSGANVVLRWRKKGWSFFFFPIPFAIRLDKIELALKEPSEFVQLLKDRLSASQSTI